MKKIVIIAILLFSNIIISYSQNTVYNPDISKKNAQALLNRLYSDMQGLHPNLYEHISKENYDKAYLETLHNLDTADFYKPWAICKEFQSFVALCRDSHSGVSLFRAWINPAKFNPKDYETLAKRDSIISVFPFTFNIIHGKMYVSCDLFSQGAIPEKSEIVSINSQSTKDWLQEKRKRLSEDRDAHKDAIISFYSQYKILPTKTCIFGYIRDGEQDTTYKTLDCRVHVLKYDEYLSSAYNFDEEDKIVSFKPLENGRVGLVKMFSFYPLKTMLPLVENILDSLQYYHAEDLIIDLRKSPGGHAEIVREFIDRITDNPYRQVSEELFFIKYAMKDCSNKHVRKIWQDKKYIKKKDVKRIWSEGRDTIIRHQFDEIQPKDYENKFKGRVWVMVGPYTNSAAVEFASVVQDCKIGIVVGEETGGVQNCYGNPMYYPLTDILNDKLIRFDYIAPHIKHVRPSGDDSAKLHGVMPDIELSPNYALKEDVQLNELVEIIKYQN